MKFSFLQAIISKVDAAAMWDAIEYNGGFIIIRPTANGIKLWQLTCDLTSVNGRVNDQTAFNIAMKRLNSKMIYKFDYTRIVNPGWENAIKSVQN